jgi:putative transcriptional regulator
MCVAGHLDGPMPNVTGKILIASPHLEDRNFFRTVVLVIRHEPSGAYGLVLNRQTEFDLAEMLEKLTGDRPAHTFHLFWGGPVSGPLTAIHTTPKCGEFVCIDGAWGTTDQTHIATLLATGQPIQMRFFAGYSGWGEGQLDAELSGGGWLIGEALLADLFGDHSRLWETAIRRVGRRVFGGLLCDDDGFDPSVN